MSAPVVRHPLDTAALAIVEAMMAQVSRAYQGRAPVASVIATEAAGMLLAAEQIVDGRELLHLVMDLRLDAIEVAAEERVNEDFSHFRRGTAAMCGGRA